MTLHAGVKAKYTTAVPDIGIKLFDLEAAGCHLGVQTALDVLTSLGFELFQGYLLGMPTLEALSALDLSAFQ